MASFSSNSADQNDTIIACATPTGYSSIAVIRLSGEQTISLANRVFIPSENIQSYEPNHAYYGRVIDPDTNEVLDTVIATFFFAPRSYTGEDVVEFSCHGNPLIVEKIVKIVLELGARIAGRGEFTKRALLNGKIDLLQAEAVLDTVYATCDEARRLAIGQYEGILSEKIHEMRTKIVVLLSLIEANIDFPEEEDVSFDKMQFDLQIKELIDDINKLLGGAEIGVKIKEGYKVVIVGRANVGKSTLFNRLICYDRAIVHESPGTTRDYIEEAVELGNLYLRLVDTAGILLSASGPDRIAGSRSQALVDDADLILLLFDGSEPLNEEDIQIYNLTKNKQKILIINKIDLNIQLKETEILNDAIKLSAKTGDNVDLLKERIKNSLRSKIENKDILLTRHRHIQSLKDIKNCLTNINNCQTLETIAFELHTILDIVGELTGKVMRKEILDKIFEEFCIGK